MLLGGRGGGITVHNSFLDEGQRDSAENTMEENLVLTRGFLKNRKDFE